MKITLLEHLACPDCAGDLLLRDAKMAGDDVAAGALCCAGCARAFPIDRGVPNFVAAEDSDDVIQTTDGFARNWNDYNEVILDNEALNDELFRDWIAPVDPATFAGKLVVEPGCGMGRWLRVAAKYSPRTLIGIDYSAIAYTAAQNVRDLENVHVIRADIRRLPLKKRVETIYCLGVIHHMPAPEEAFDNLVSVLGPGGTVNVWVYGKEGNGWIHSLVTPLRQHVTSRLPHRLLGWLSSALAVPLRAASMVAVRFPVPYRDYLRYLSRYPFRYMTHVIYDHLVPEIAHYLSREEIERWPRKHGLDYELTARNGNSWRLLTRRPAASRELENTGS